MTGHVLTSLIKAVFSGRGIVTKVGIAVHALNGWNAYKDLSRASASRSGRVKVHRVGKGIELTGCKSAAQLNKRIAGGEHGIGKDLASRRFVANIYTVALDLLALAYGLDRNYRVGRSDSTDCDIDKASVGWTANDSGIRHGTSAVGARSELQLEGLGVTNVRKTAARVVVGRWPRIRWVGYRHRNLAGICWSLSSDNCIGRSYGSYRRRLGLIVKNRRRAIATTAWVVSGPAGEHDVIVDVFLDEMDDSRLANDIELGTVMRKAIVPAAKGHRAPSLLKGLAFGDHRPFRVERR